MNILVTGATGLVGKRLVKHLLASGHQVTIISRSLQKSEPGVEVLEADLVKGALKDPRLRSIHAVVNLMGESIFGWHWTQEKKTRIRESRVIGTRNLIASLKASGAYPRVFVSASAVGYYGDRGDELLTEDSSSADDFLAQVCVAWERSAMEAKELWPECRVVITRFGVVLSPDGGLLKKMKLPFSFSAGTVLGNGKQWMSWIHESDLTEIIIMALSDTRLKGLVNAVSPMTTTNFEFSKCLAEAAGTLLIARVPALLLRMSLGEMANLMLFSQRVKPEALEKVGFRFRFPELKSAL